MMAGVFAGAMAGGAKAFGEYSEKIKTAREAKKAAAAASASGATTTAGAVGTSGATTVEAVDRTAHIADTLSMGADAGFDMSSVKVYQPPTTASTVGNLSNVIAPKSAEAAPTLFAGFNKSMSDTMKKYTLATGAYSIASYRPELQKLKPMVTIPSNKRYG